jgi:hypothetical protein
MSDPRRGFWLQIGVTDHLQVVTTNNYNIIADLHTLQIAIGHAKYFQFALTSRFPATDLNNRGSSTAPTKSSFHILPYDRLLATD